MILEGEVTMMGKTYIGTYALEIEVSQRDFERFQKIFDSNNHVPVLVDYRGEE